MKINSQKGVSIIAVVATMLILSVMGVVLVSLVTTGSDISVNQLRSEQALNIAEGGKEYALKQLRDNPSYTGDANKPLGNGSFTVIVTDLGSGIKRVTSSGSAGSAAKAVEVTTQGGNIVANGTFATDISGWTETLSQSDGFSAWSSIPAINGSPGSLLAKTTDCSGDGCRNLFFSGYREQGISISSGATVSLQMAYCKNAIGFTGGGSRLNTYIDIVYQGGTTYRAWSDISQPPNPSCSNGATWSNVNVSFTTTDPAVAVRIVYNLKNHGGSDGANSQKQAWFDEVKLSLLGGSSILSWQEVYQ